jgi:hypothetical protein
MVFLKTLISRFELAVKPYSSEAVTIALYTKFSRAGSPRRVFDAPSWYLSHSPVSPMN